ncbi:uncharacterized protein LY79DRAFT_575844 [Colletotrichum navitas]|uniref:Uncharacterized protein n=1 Tax=Colletotrichum navitas TaxID=681940 RepID=A0AAD8VBQ2_9PEZI|nr:uncharacterized protein LY79DRAFT_575844 [Colletotrichum navitas]KAK1598685.1 hypothetical protein LY79DRAFT_575844 [Colletotrichum navitas]
MQPLRKRDPGLYAGSPPEFLTSTVSMQISPSQTNRGKSTPREPLPNENKPGRYTMIEEFAANGPGPVRRGHQLKQHGYLAIGGGGFWASSRFDQPTLARLLCSLTPAKRPAGFQHSLAKEIGRSVAATPSASSIPSQLHLSYPGVTWGSSGKWVASRSSDR